MNSFLVTVENKTDSERKFLIIQGILVTQLHTRSLHCHNINQPAYVKVKVGVLHLVQHPGSYRDRSVALPLVGIAPTQR